MLSATAMTAISLRGTLAEVAPPSLGCHDILPHVAGCGDRLNPTSLSRSHCILSLGLMVAAATMNHRIKRLSGESSPEFAGVRAAAQIARAYSGELGWTAVNCNPKLQPWELMITLLPGRNLITQQW
jgi:hypothetical protein